jgi:hypothetical protein
VNESGEEKGAGSGSQCEVRVVGWVVTPLFLLDEESEERDDGCIGILPEFEGDRSRSCAAERVMYASLFGGLRDMNVSGAPWR